MPDLDKVRRILEDLKATREFLRQYPGLVDKRPAALERIDRSIRPGA
jgi:hypothetical protein